MPKREPQFVVKVRAKNGNGKWSSFEPMTWTKARELAEDIKGCMPMLDVMIAQSPWAEAISAIDVRIKAVARCKRIAERAERMSKAS